MILGSKPISEMSEDELRAGIEELRSQREALRNEAIKEKKAREAKGLPEKKVRMPKAPNEAQTRNADMLAFLRGDKDEF